MIIRSKFQEHSLNMSFNPKRRLYNLIQSFTLYYNPIKKCTVIRSNGCVHSNLHHPAYYKHETYNMTTKLTGNWSLKEQISLANFTYDLVPAIIVSHVSSHILKVSGEKILNDLQNNLLILILASIAILI